MLNFYDFIQVFVFTRNHHLKTNLELSTESFQIQTYSIYRIWVEGVTGSLIVLIVIALLVCLNLDKKKHKWMRTSKCNHPYLTVIHILTLKMPNKNCS